MSTPSRVTIQETYEMPSRGKFPGVPDKVTIRAMSLMDEKQRLASSGISGILDLIGNCVIKPEGFNPYKMCRFDLDFLTLKLRIVSHGPMYDVEVRCPHCGKVIKTKINLDEIACNSVDDNFSYEFEAGPLPLSGDTLTLKILTYEDVDKIESETKRILAKFPNYEGDPSEVLNYIYRISKINGEKVPYTHLKQYVESMTAADAIFIDQIYEDIVGNYGIDTDIPFTCDSCKETFVRSMPMNSEFFRPRYDTAKRQDV